MPRGGPDYGNPVNQQAVKTVDPGEITRARLNTDTLDGKGRMFWFDDFHSNLSAWNIGQGGAAKYPIIDVGLGTSEVPPSSLLLSPGVKYWGF